MENFEQNSPDEQQTSGVERDFAGGFEQIDIREESRHFGITLRAVIVGLLIILVIAIGEPYNAWYKGNTYLIGNHFPIAVVSMLLVLILIANPLMKRLMPGSQFAPSELVVIFILSYSACCIPGSGLIRYWLTLLTGGFFFTKEHPEWAETVFNWKDISVKQWLFPSTDPNSLVIEKFWKGYGTGQDIPWSELISAWAVPFLAWGVFFVAIFVCMWCLASLLRRQWVENEKLSFPLAQVALEIMRPAEKGKLLNNLFRNKLLWIGASIAIFIHAVNALNKVYPNVPAIPIERDLGQLFTNAPWNMAAGGGGYLIFTRIRIFFMAVGLSYFITTRCSFSLWFFVILVALVPVAGAQLGYPVHGDIWKFHFFGAMIVLMASMLWVSRAHLKLILLSVLGLHKESEEGEYMSYRTAAIIFLVAFAGAVLWLTYAGMKFYFAIFILAVLFMIFLTMARIVAETGVFFVQPPTQLGPMNVTDFFKFPPVSKSNYLLGSIVNTQFWDLRESQLPYAVNALRVADGAKRIGRRQWLIPLLLLGMLVAYAAAASSYGYTAYRFGAQSFPDTAAAGGQADSINKGTYERVSTYDTKGNEMTFNPVLQTAIGGAVMALLAFARFRWTRWPLYPVGWLLAGAYPMKCFWFSIFLGWLLKATILKFSGAGLYNRLKPLFIGLIIGDVIISGVLTSLVLFTGVSFGPDFATLPK